MKSNPILVHCPVCDHNLKVEKLSCNHCKTVIEGSFELSKFNYLGKEKLYFIEIFMKNRGNIKGIEKELNISYPTVKKMLDEVIVELGYDVNEEDVVLEQKESREEILDQIKKGTLSVEEALKKMKG